MIDEMPPAWRPEEAPALVEACAQVMSAQGLRLSVRALLEGEAESPAQLSPEGLLRTLKRHGCSARWVRRDWQTLSAAYLPAVVKTQAGGFLVLQQLEAAGVRITVPETGAERVLTQAQAAETLDAWLLLIQPLVHVSAQRAPEGLGETRGWLWSAFRTFLPAYRDVVIATLLINLFALASAFFSMQVYDRVVPSLAFSTLWVLAIGVMLAILIESALRVLRAHVMEDVGKRVDVLLSARLFRHLLALRLEDRPTNSGSFANQLREFDAVREFIGAVTLTGLVDLPFCLLFITILALINPVMVLPVLVAVPLLVGLGWLAYRKIAGAIASYLQESAWKQGIAVEAVQHLPGIRAANAGTTVRRRWEQSVALTASANTVTRHWSSHAALGAQTLQQMTVVALLVLGVYQIGEAALSLGGLIAVTILAGRAMAPLAQLSTLIARYQVARTSYESLNRFMELQEVRQVDRSYLSQPRCQGQITLTGVKFHYAGMPAPACEVPQLGIRPGERIAVVGAVGSGKTTLLNLLGSLVAPTNGMLLYDGVAAAQIDPADIRANIAYLPQTPFLLQGSLRENVLLGLAGIDDARLLSAAQATGLDQVVNRHPAGWELPIGQGGEGLSGGQRQLVALTRALLSSAPILLLDEPTGSVDIQAEQHLVKVLDEHCAGRTLIFTTHRPAMLNLATRVLMMANGRVISDKPRASAAKPAATAATVTATVSPASKPASETST